MNHIFLPLIIAINILIGTAQAASNSSDDPYQYSKIPDIETYATKQEDKYCDIEISLPLTQKELIHHITLDDHIVYTSPETAPHEILHQQEDQPLIINTKICTSELSEIKIILTNGLIIEQYVKIKPHNSNRAASLTSYVIKAAVKKLAKTLTSASVLKKAERYGGKLIANAIKKYATQITKKLNELSKWSDLTLEAIQDQIAGMLIDLGVGASTARTIGFVIKQLVWLLF